MAGEYNFELSFAPDVSYSYIVHGDVPCNYQPLYSSQKKKSKNTSITVSTPQVPYSPPFPRGSLWSKQNLILLSRGEGGSRSLQHLAAINLYMALYILCVCMCVCAVLQRGSESLHQTGSGGSFPF